MNMQSRVIFCDSRKISIIALFMFDFKEATWMCSMIPSAYLDDDYDLAAIPRVSPHYRVKFILNEASYVG